MILWIFYIILDALVNWYIIEKKKVVPNYIQLMIAYSGVRIFFTGERIVRLISWGTSTLLFISFLN